VEVACVGRSMKKLRSNNNGCTYCNDFGIAFVNEKLTLKTKEKHTVKKLKPNCQQLMGLDVLYLLPPGYRIIVVPVAQVDKLQLLQTRTIRKKDEQKKRGKFPKKSTLASFDGRKNVCTSKKSSSLPVFRLPLDLEEILSTENRRIYH
jgi:hypothetical protein